MDNTNHTEPKTTAPMRDLNEDEPPSLGTGTIANL